MPFRHVAMFRWAEHVDAAHIARVDAAYDELVGQVGGLRHHAHGSDVGVSEGAFDYLVVADFATVAEWRAYRDHPAHVLLVEELIVGHAVDRAGGQFQAPEGQGVAPSVRSALLADPEAACVDADGPSDEELMARARRVASAEMEALLAEPDDLP